MKTLLVRTVEEWRDWLDEQKGKPTLRAFHDAFLAQGAAPFPALRRLMLELAGGDILE